MTTEKYKAIIDKNLSTTFADKYVIVHAETNRLLADANGAGFDSEEKAIRAYKTIIKDDAISKIVEEDGTVVATKNTETNFPTKNTPILDELFSKYPNDIFLFGKCQKIKSDNAKKIVDDKICVVVMKTADDVYVTNKQIGNFNDTVFILKTIEKCIKGIKRDSSVRIVIDGPVKKTNKLANQFMDKINDVAKSNNISIAWEPLDNISDEIKLLVSWPSLLKNDYKQLEFSYENKGSSPKTNLKQELFKNKLLTSAYSDSETIPTLAPVIGDFVVSDKSLGRIFTSTGKGKSYSLTVFMYEVIKMRQSGVYQRCLYCTDRNNNVDAEYHSLLNECKKIGIEKNQVMRIRRHVEYVIEGYEVLRKLKDNDLIKSSMDIRTIDCVLQYMKTHGIHLKKSEEEKKRQQDELVDNRAFQEIEKALRDELRKMLSRRFKKEGIEKSDWTEKRKLIDAEYPLLPELYPCMYIQDAQVLFFTVQKGMSIIDTIWREKIELFSSNEFLNKSLLFIDEADAAYVNMLETEAKERSENNLELRYYTKVLGDGFSRFEQFPVFAHTNEKIEQEVKELNESYIELSNVYNLHMGLRTLNSMDEQFVFFDQNKNVPIFSKDEWHIDYNETDGVMEIVDTPSESSIPFLEYVVKLNEFINRALILCKKLCELYREYYNNEKKNKCTPIESSYSVLDFLGINNANKYRNTIALDVLNITKQEIEEGVSKDIYIRPNSLISTSKEEYDEINTKIYRHAIVNTPERRLLTMLQSGAKVLLSSATVWNHSANYNFDLSWEEFIPYIYIPTESTVMHEVRYAKSMEEFKRDIDIVETKSGSIMKQYVMEKLEVKGNLDNLLSELDTGDNDKNFEIERIIKLLYSTITLLELGHHRIFSCVNKDIGKNYDVLLPIFNLIEKKYNTKFHTAISKTIDSVIRNMQNDVRMGYNIVFISTYNTVSKGTNIKFPMQFNESTFENDFYILNKRGKEKLKMDINKKKPFEFDVDFDGLYLEKQRNMLPSIPEKTDYKNKIKSILLCSSTNDKLYKFEEISELKRNENIIKFLRKSKYPFDKALPSAHIKQLVNIIQTVGRISRCWIQSNKTTIIIDSEIDFKQFRGFNNFIDKSIYEQVMGTMAYKVKAVCEYLFKSKMKTTPVNAIAVEVQCEKCTNSIIQALKNIHSDPSQYKIYNSIDKLSITNEEYGLLSDPMKECYLSIPYKGYSYNEYRVLSGHHIPRYALPLSDGRQKISKESIPLCNISQKMVEKCGFDLDDTKEYKLNPAAFDKLKGNIGECVVEHYLEMFAFKELDDMCFEKMDGFIKTDDFIISYDAKLFNLMDPKFDQKEEKLEYFYNKCFSISQQNNGLPVLGLIVNASYIKEKIKHESVSQLWEYGGDDHIRFLTIPNIFHEEDGNVTWSKTVREELGYRIREFLTTSVV